MSKSEYKPRSACSRAVLIELCNWDFHDFLRKNCLIGRFKTQRGEEVTLLIPDSKRLESMKKITDERELEQEVMSLILVKRYASLTDFEGETIQNKAGGQIKVKSASGTEVVLENGCKLTPVDIAVQKNYFAAYKVSGTEKMYSDGDQIVREQRKPKTGGSFMLLSGPLRFIQRVQKKVESIYRKPVNEYASKNIYFQKVYLQLRILKKNKPHLFTDGTIIRHLGNEEISTSYLLDTITDEHCARELFRCFGNDGPCPEKLANITFANFVSEYNAAVTSGPNYTTASDVDTQFKSLQSARTHIDGRTACRTAYGGDNERLGKDLFIHFTNIIKHRWLIERRDSLLAGAPMSALDNETFDSYITSTKWCWTLGDLSERATREPSVEDDFRDFVGILKTDVFLFVPRPLSATAPYVVPPAGFEIITTEHLPEINEKKFYSLCELMARLSSTGGLYLGGGRSREVDEALDNYL